MYGPDVASFAARRGEAAITSAPPGPSHRARGLPPVHRDSPFSSGGSRCEGSRSMSSTFARPPRSAVAVSAGAEGIQISCANVLRPAYEHPVDQPQSTM